MEPHRTVDLLLVEDNQNDAALTIRALKKRGVLNNIIVLRDGAKALEYMFSEGEYAGRVPDDGLPRVILLDLKLPKVDGFEVLSRLKSDERTRMVPVVMLTSSREEQDIVRSYRFGANSYIVKPVDFKNFSDAISEVALFWMILNEPPPPIKGPPG